MYVACVTVLLQILSACRLLELDISLYLVLASSTVLCVFLPLPRIGVKIFICIYYQDHTHAHIFLVIIKATSIVFVGRCIWYDFILTVVCREMSKWTDWADVFLVMDYYLVLVFISLWLFSFSFSYEKSYFLVFVFI